MYQYVNSSPAPDSASSVTSVRRLSCHHPTSLLSRTFTVLTLRRANTPLEHAQIQWRHGYRYFGESCETVFEVLNTLKCGMPDFRWSEENEVFLAQIDAEHRDLFRIADGLQQAVAGKATAAVKEHLDALIAHAEEHFSHEEWLMQSVKYSSYIA